MDELIRWICRIHHDDDGDDDDDDGGGGGGGGHDLTSSSSLCHVLVSRVHVHAFYSISMYQIKHHWAK